MCVISSGGCRCVLGYVLRERSFILWCSQTAGWKDSSCHCLCHRFTVGLVWFGAAADSPLVVQTMLPAKLQGLSAAEHPSSVRHNHLYCGGVKKIYMQWPFTKLLCYRLCWNVQLNLKKYTTWSRTESPISVIKLCNQCIFFFYGFHHNCSIQH